MIPQNIKEDFTEKKINWNKVSAKVERMTGKKKTANFLQSIYTGKLQSKYYYNILIELLGEPKFGNNG
jgi:hypothetical protein